MSVHEGTEGEQVIEEENHDVEREAVIDELNSEPEDQTGTFICVISMGGCRHRHSETSP